MRVIADHIRSAVFLIADGVIPSNKAQGYFCRRLVRRGDRQSRTNLELKIIFWRKLPIRIRILI